MYKKMTDERRQKLSLAAIKALPEENKIILSGEWTWVSIDEQIVNIVQSLPVSQWQIDGLSIKRIDTAGAYFLHKLCDSICALGGKIQQVNLIEEDLNLFNLTKGIALESDSIVNESIDKTWVEKTYQGLSEFWHTSLQLISFFGQLCYTSVTLFKREYPLYIKGILDTISTAGIKGILITSSLCFLIGVNLTYQMAPQFVTYGANVYVVNFLGISLLREVTPLLTAIIIAGRTGSAITASIGTMKVQEEIDALQTMGISPVRRLVMPQVIGLLVSLPILTMLADAASMFGGMLFAGPLLGIDFSLFLERMQGNVSINNFWIGILKSVFFAWIIGMVGCFCGFKVKSSSDSVGVQTTRSVVISICLIIVVDALFAILFKALGVK